MDKEACPHIPRAAPLVFNHNFQVQPITHCCKISSANVWGPPERIICFICYWSSDWYKWKAKKKKTLHSEFHVHHFKKPNSIKLWWFYLTFFLNPKQKELQVLSDSKTIFKSDKVQSSVLEGFMSMTRSDEMDMKMVESCIKKDCWELIKKECNSFYVVPASSKLKKKRKRKWSNNISFK